MPCISARHRSHVRVKRPLPLGRRRHSTICHALVLQVRDDTRPRAMQLPSSNRQTRHGNADDPCFHAADTHVHERLYVDGEPTAEVARARFNWEGDDVPVQAAE